MDAFVKRASKEILPGLELVRDFLTLEEERALLACVDECEWDTTLKRRTQHYGHRYSYASGSAAALAPPIPEWCAPYVDRLVERGLLRVRPDQMIVNEYVPGQGIAGHVDSTVHFADGIASVSLGSDTVMDFTLGAIKREVLLPRRSVVVMHGEARYRWRHGISARKSDRGVKRGRRVSLTFRKMK